MELVYWHKTMGKWLKSNESVTYMHTDEGRVIEMTDNGSRDITNEVEIYEQYGKVYRRYKGKSNG